MRNAETSVVDSRWFRRYHRPVDDTPRTRLICFPHAGGAAGGYAALARRLAPRLDVYAVQYPGRHDRRHETPEHSLTALAARIAERLLEGTRGPYALFGHSMGALVAYETARVLARHGAPAPARLILSGRGAPTTTPDPHDRLDGDDAILAAVRRLGGTGAAVLDNPELLALALPVLRADYAALADYRWTAEPMLSTPLSIFAGTDDPLVPQRAAAAWADLTSATSETLMFPGGHFYLGDQLDTVAEAIADLLPSLPVGPRGR
ncbi:alpha/beta fold hydrolase [Streptomyces sp. NPDC005840]|uniref:thioesterase II family protein n=1 Tax=Streptomyces sp. NPDC005840 TaxID=3157072 RepID=UPI0033FEA104